MYQPRYLFAGAVWIIPSQLVTPYRDGDGDAPDTAKRRAVRTRYARQKCNTVGAPYRLVDIGERDAWVCHLCGKPVDRTLSGRHPKGPTADHLIPVAHGGGDDPHNVALAHSRCNIKRGTGGVVQLRLVG